MPKQQSISESQLIYEATRERGEPVEPRFRARMEACFGVSFEDVRLHFSLSSHRVNQAMGSLAFAVDRHICFRNGVAARNRASFEYLLAHELAHVAQKLRGTGAARSCSHMVSEAELESEASALAMLALQGWAAPRITPDPCQAPRCFGPAGHYYTAYWTSLAVGFDQLTAARIAFFTQMPDQVKELDATAAGISMGEDLAPSSNPIQTVESAIDAFQELTVQTGLHSLTGLLAVTETEIRTRNFDGLNAGSLEFGLAVHAYGDSYAHRELSTGQYMYSPGLGHAVEKFNGVDPHLPDNMNHRPILYHEYGKKLYGILLSKTPNGSKPQVPLPDFESDLDNVSTVTDEPGQIVKLLEKIQSVLGKSGSGDVTEFMKKMYRPETDDTHGFPLQKSDIQLPPEWKEFYQKHTSDVQQSGMVDALNWAKQWSHCAVPFKRSVTETIQGVEHDFITVMGLNLSPIDFINQLYGGMPH